MFTRIALLLALFLIPLSALAADISAVDAQKLLKGNPPAFLLDVRSTGEYMNKRIEGGKLIPIDQLQGRVQEIPRDRPVVVYCETGVRSSLVTNYLTRLGYPKVYNMTGGIMAWQVRGYPIVTGRP